MIRGDTSRQDTPAQPMDFVITGPESALQLPSYEDVIAMDILPSGIIVELRVETPPPTYQVHMTLLCIENELRAEFVEANAEVATSEISSYEEVPSGIIGEPRADTPPPAYEQHHRDEIFHADEEVIANPNSPPPTYDEYMAEFLQATAGQ